MNSCEKFRIIDKQLTADLRSAFNELEHQGVIVVTNCEEGPSLVEYKFSTNSQIGSINGLERIIIQHSAMLNPLTGILMWEIPETHASDDFLIWGRERSEWKPEDHYLWVINLEDRGWIPV